MKRNLNKARVRSCRGFTLIELMIVVCIMLILVSVAVPNFSNSVKRARESVLRQNLFTMRDVISQYTLDKQKAPQSLQDLSQAGYLKQIPTDPMTNASDWQTEECPEDTLASPDEQDQGGVCDVHSNSGLTGTDGRPYNQW